MTPISGDLLLQHGFTRQKFNLITEKLMEDCYTIDLVFNKRLDVNFYNGIWYAELVAYNPLEKDDYQIFGIKNNKPKSFEDISVLYTAITGDKLNPLNT